MGQIVFQATLGGQTALVGQNTASSYSLTLPLATDTLVGKATTDTLTNKTLTAPVISSIVNTGTLTLPTSTDTLVGRATTDTLTNKTLTSPTLVGPILGTPASGSLLYCTDYPTSSLNGTINLATQVSGTLAVNRGGTGIATLTAGYIPFGAGTSAFNSTSNLFWDNTNTRLGIGTSSPQYVLDISSGSTVSSRLIASGSSTDAKSIYTSLGPTGTTVTLYTGTFGSQSAGVVTTLTNHPLIFGTYNQTNTMTFDTSGRLLIGTSSASGSNYLQVNSDATISGLTVGKGGGGDIYSTALGTNALLNNTSGISNTAVGRGSLSANTTGSGNTAVARDSLVFNTTGSNNSAFGYGALAFNTTASNNTAVGYQAGYTNSTGTNLTAIGYGALYGNTTGSSNSALGLNALQTNSTGGSNTAVGVGALQLNTTASNNTAVGYQASYSNTTGASNASLGYASLFSNTTGNYNTAIGQNALSANTTASNNTAVGYRAMYSNTTGADNTSVGVGALYGNTTGGSNAAFGENALTVNSTGNYNTALGTGALTYTTTASEGTAVGYQAGYANTTGGRNTSLGYQAGYSCSTNDSNLFVGWKAGFNTTGTGNTFVGGRNTTVGTSSGALVTTGSNNTILGAFDGNQSGLDIRTASNYIVLSDGAGNPRGIFDGSGNLMVGPTTAGGAGGMTLVPSASTPYITTVGSATSGGNAYYLYSTGASAARFYVDYGGTVHATSIVITAISDQRLKENIRDLDTGLNAVMSLKPRRFDWKEGKGQDKKNAAGFIAQEYQEIFPNSISTFKAGGDGIEYLTMNHEELIPTLVKAIQELKAEVDSLKQQLNGA